MPRWPTLTVEARFWRLVDRSGGPSACWPFIGSINAYGYGHFRLDASTIVRAHRLAVVFGDPPDVPGRPLADDELVRHTCPAPCKRCCNPRHLEPGDHSENLIDAYRNGERRRFRLKPARALKRT